jgi:toxin FitB
VRYLVDTNVVSELRKGRRCHAGVAAFFAQAPADSLFLSVLTLGELRKGIEQIRGRDQEQAQSLDAWLRNLQRFYASRILAVDAEVAERWGELNARRTFPVVDALLAATALVHDLTLVTRNARDVAGSGAVVFDPFA